MELKLVIFIVKKYRKSEHTGEDKIKKQLINDRYTIFSQR